MASPFAKHLNGSPQELAEARAGSAEVLGPYTPTPRERASASEELATVEVALAELPEHYQVVLRLRYHQRRTFSDMGTALNCSSEAACKLWARAVEQLQKKLSCLHERR